MTNQAEINRVREQMKSEPMLYRVDAYMGDNAGSLPIFVGDAEEVLWVHYTFAGYLNHGPSYSVLMVL